MKYIKILPNRCAVLRTYVNILPLKPKPRSSFGLSVHRFHVSILHSTFQFCDFVPQFTTFLKRIWVLQLVVYEVVAAFTAVVIVTVVVNFDKLLSMTTADVFFTIVTFLYFIAFMTLLIALTAEVTPAFGIGPAIMICTCVPCALLDTAFTNMFAILATVLATFDMHSAAVAAITNIFVAIEALIRWEAAFTHPFATIGTGYIIG